MNKLTGRVLLSSVVGLAIQASASAQDASQRDAQAELGEIIVTASKREESITKVGMTITALTADQLAERKITALEDIAAIVPGLTYTPSTTNTPIFTLRGIGFNESSLGVYPAVSVYVDQVPLPFPVMASHAAFDLERVEVLKGPQGTLFGQNSTGGAINYIAARPTKTFTAGADVSYGRFNQIDGNVFVSGPLSDAVGFRLAMTGLHMDDWQKSYTRRDTNGHQSYIAGRLLLDFEPSETARVALNLNGWKDKSQPQAQQLVAVHEQRGGVTSALRAFYSPPIYGAASPQLGYPFAPHSPRAADWSTRNLDPSTAVTDPNSGVSDTSTALYSEFDPFSDRRLYQGSLRGDVEIGAGITLTSLTSYADYDQKQATDGDGMWVVEYDLEKGLGSIKNFNQELRLANDPSSSFRWLLGANYEHSKTFEDQMLRFFANSTFAPDTLFINASGVIDKQKIENYAAFASGEFSFTDQLTLKAAARYTKSDIKANICSYTTENGNVNRLFNILGSLNFGGLNPPPAFDPIPPEGCYTLNEQFVPGEPFIRSLKEDNVSWRIGIDFQATPDALVYGNVSRGYKAGSFPALAAASYTGLKPVTQESVTAFEAGTKLQLADRRVAISAAAFYLDYKDKQVRGKILDDPNIFGTLDALVNVPKSRIYGAEAEITVRPVDSLTLTLAGTYLNSRIKKYVGFDIFGGLDNPDFDPAGDNKEDLSGNPLPYTPKWTGVLNVDYRMAAIGNGTPFLGFTVNARSGQDAAIGGGKTTLPVGPGNRLAPGVIYPYTIDGYATVDARLGYEGDDGRWKVMFWAKNLFNKYYWTAVIPASDSSARFAGRPATYGVSFGYRFQ